MVQRRAASFIFNDYSYNTSVTSPLITLNWPTLQNRRINLRAIMFYKIVNNLIGIPTDSLLLHNSSSTHHHHHCYSVPYSRINAQLFSFFPFMIRIWNHLSAHTACSPSLKIFKDRILKENLTMFCPICVCWPIRVSDIPYAYGISHTRMGHNIAPYAYGRPI